MSVSKRKKRLAPHFAKHDKKMFNKYLQKAKIYFEFGAGGSTYKAYRQSNLKKIYSVESDISWYHKVKKHVGSDHRLQFFFIDLQSRKKSWGRPGSNSAKSEWIKYSNSALQVNDSIDLALIDGRFRVACALKLFNVLDSKALIVFDDFYTRPEYHIVLDFYTVIEQTKDHRMVILAKKVNAGSPSPQLIAKYELDSR